MFDDMIPGMTTGGGIGDFRSLMQTEEFYKAVVADGGATPSDHATLIGGAALRRESLEASLLVTTARYQHFSFWNWVPKSRATATVDEWSRQLDIGGLPGSSANSETGDIAESTGDYAREVALVKYLMDRRRVTLPAEMQSVNGLGSAIAKETDNGSRKLLLDADYLCFYGDADVAPTEFTGMYAILDALGGDHVIDLAGGTISPDASEFLQAAEVIMQPDNYGNASDYFTSPGLQKDIDLTLFPSFRFVLDNAPQRAVIGAPVRGITTSFSDQPITTHIDRFIQEGQAPYAVRGAKFLAVVGTINVPTAVVATATHNAAGSNWKASQEGNYYWAVEGGQTGVGRSTLYVSNQVAVKAGDSIAVVITEPATVKGTYYAVYRSRQDGTNAAADFREMKRIKVNGGGTTTYTDLNNYVPGTSFIIVLTKEDDAVTFRRFGDQQRFPLFPTSKAETPWAQLLFGYLRVGKSNQHVLIKNGCPSKSKWQPFTPQP